MATHVRSHQIERLKMSEPTKTLTREHINAMEKRHRANLINSLSGYKSANLLGTVNARGQTNLALVSSVFHIGAHPPLVGMLMRPHSVPRHSLENLMELGVYTLNVVTQQMYREAHQTTARYPQEQSEFAAVGLTEEYSAHLKAPYVAREPDKDRFVSDRDANTCGERHGAGDWGNH